LEKVEIANQSSYHEWLKTFQELCGKLPIDEKELLDVYLHKNKINQERAKAK